MSHRETLREVDYHKREQQKEAEWTQSSLAEDTVAACSRALAGGHPERHAYVAERLLTGGEYDDGTYPALVGLLRRLGRYGRLAQYGRDLSEYDRWHGDALQRLLRQQRQYLPPRTPGQRLDVEDAFDALSLIAEAEEIVDSELTNEAPVRGHALELGTLHDIWQRDTPDEVQIVRPDDSPPLTVIQGTRGKGKTTGLHSEVEDRYAAGKKVVDLLDMSELENGLWDVRQQQAELRRARIELGLPPDFTHHDDYDPPDVEILCPLTERLCESDVPYDTDSDSYTVRPFTIPAASMPRSTLFQFLSGRTNVQETYLNRAYQTVTDDHDDWSLRDLAEELRETDAKDGVKRRVYNILSTLQDVGFVRTRDCEHALTYLDDGHGYSWEELFKDTGTITAFTTSRVEEETHKYMISAYLISSIYEARTHPDMPGLPPVVGVIRELHNVAPSDPHPDERIRKLQQASRSAFEKSGAEGRHENIEFLCDTQDWLRQVYAKSRIHFERFISFQTDSGDARKFWRETIGSQNRGPYIDRMTQFEPGEAAILGRTGTKRPFEMPISWAPPMSHHIPEHESGWEARERYKDSEEFRAAPWESALPDALEFEEYDALEGDDEEEDEGADKSDIEKVKASHRDEAKHLRSNGLSVRAVLDELTEQGAVNPETGEPYSTYTIHKWTKDHQQQPATGDD